MGDHYDAMWDAPPFCRHCGTLHRDVCEQGRIFLEEMSKMRKDPNYISPLYGVWGDKK